MSAFHTNILYVFSQSAQTFSSRTFFMTCLLCFLVFIQRCLHNTQGQSGISVWDQKTLCYLHILSCSLNRWVSCHRLCQTAPVERSVCVCFIRGEDDVMSLTPLTACSNSGVIVPSADYCVIWSLMFPEDMWPLFGWDGRRVTLCRSLVLLQCAQSVCVWLFRKPLQHVAYLVNLPQNSWSNP